MTFVSATRSELTISSQYQDADVVELAITVWNGLFAGSANLYVAQNGLEEVANALRGFPTGPADERTVNMGTFEPKLAGGGVRLYFHCVDRAGHAQVDITLQEAHTSSSFMQRVQMFADVEPASVDDFVTELIGLNRNMRQQATLRFANGLTRT